MFSVQCELWSAKSVLCFYFSLIGVIQFLALNWWNTCLYAAFSSISTSSSHHSLFLVLSSPPHICAKNKTGLTGNVACVPSHVHILQRCCDILLEFWPFPLQRPLLELMQCALQHLLRGRPLWASSSTCWVYTTLQWRLNSTTGIYLFNLCY